MKTARHLLAATLVALTLASPVGAAEKQPDAVAFKAQTQIDLKNAKDDIGKLKDEVKELGKTAITRSEADKHAGDRLNDMSSRIGDIDIWLTSFSIIVSVALGALALIGFFTVSAKARKEAQDEARKAVDDWLRTHEADLKQRIKAAEDFAAESRTHIQAFEDEIKQLKAQLSDKLIAHTNQQMAETAALADEAKRRIQASMAQPSGPATPAVPPAALQALQAQAESLRHKEEADYTFEDWDDRAFAAFEDGKFEDAAECWKRASEFQGASPVQVVRTLVNKGIALGHLKRYGESIDTNDHVYRHFYAVDNAPPMRDLVSQALYNKANTLSKLGRTEAAVTAYELLDAHYREDTTPNMQLRLAKALIDKGLTLGQRGHTDDELKAYRRVEMRYANGTAPALRELVAKALFNSAVSLEQIGRTEDALAAYDRIEAYSTDNTTSELHKRVAKARNGKGAILLYRAKANWADLPQRQADLSAAVRLFEQAEREHPDRPLVLGNRAYCAHLRSEPIGVVRSLLERALKDGGEWLYKGIVDDLAIHPIPEDAAYRTLLDAVWTELGGNAPPPAAPPAA